MTAAQGTIQWGGSNRLAGFAAAAAAGLVVAVIGVAISARPVDVTASVAGPAGASTLSAAQQSSLYMQDLLQKAQVRTIAPNPYLEEVFPQGRIAPAKAPSLVMEDLLQKSHPVAPALDLSKVKGINLNDASIVVPLVTPSDQANAYIDSLIARGAAVQADAAAQDLSKVTGINLNDATAVAPLVTSSDQANAYIKACSPGLPRCRSPPPGRTCRR